MAFATRLVGSRLSFTGSLNVLVQQSSRTTGLDRIRPASRCRLASTRLAGLQTSSRHTYRHLANSEPPNAHTQNSTRSASSQPSTATPVTTNAAKPPASAPVALNDAQKVSDREQRLTDWAIVRKLARNIWPSGPGSTEIKIRVVGALGLLVAGKVSRSCLSLYSCGTYCSHPLCQILNVQVPFFFKQIVDSMNVEITASSTVWLLAGSAVAGCKSPQRSPSRPN